MSDAFAVSLDVWTAPEKGVLAYNPLVTADDGPSRDVQLLVRPIGAAHVSFVAAVTRHERSRAVGRCLSETADHEACFTSALPRAGKRYTHTRCISNSN